jgi:hypothetical protein
MDALRLSPTSRLFGLFFHEASATFPKVILPAIDDE